MEFSGKIKRVYSSKYLDARLRKGSQQIQGKKTTSEVDCNFDEILMTELDNIASLNGGRDYIINPNLKKD